MDEFIKLLDPAYELIQYRIKEDKVIFHIASTIAELECPFCGRKTSKVHSIYEREIQDLPMQGKKVILLVDTRKMRCMNPDCSHKTFSEKHPFVTTKSKKTNRLIQTILYTSSQLSSLNASKLLKSENISVCKSSICDLLKKMPSIVDKSSVKMVCVDDFARRKRCSYGTVMINLENHQIVDMIQSRDTNDVCNWLKTFHNLKVISRDGAITYTSAATNSHPDIIQISDRFHLIKGLSEVICKYIIRKFPARVEIPLTESITDEMKVLYNTANRSLCIKFAYEKHREGLTISDIALLSHSSPKTIQKYLSISEEQIPETMEIARERQHQLAVKQKEQEIEETRKMALAGYPIEQIATLMHHSYKTIQNYLNPDFQLQMDTIMFEFQGNWLHMKKK